MNLMHFPKPRKNTNKVVNNVGFKKFTESPTEPENWMPRNGSAMKIKTSAAQMSYRKILRNIKRKSLNRRTQYRNTNNTVIIDLANTSLLSNPASNSTINPNDVMDSEVPAQQSNFSPPKTVTSNEYTFKEPPPSHVNNTNDSKKRVKTTTWKHSNSKYSEDSSDDCILVETSVEEIILDDDDDDDDGDAVDNNNQRKLKHATGDIAETPIKRFKPTHQQTSTPFAASNQNDGLDNVDTSGMFFMDDRTRLNWFETINSEDTFANYVNTDSPNSCEVIVIDETICDNDKTLTSNRQRSFKGKRSPKKGRRYKSKNHDDSVVFVSETKPTSTTTIPLSPREYIPLESLGTRIKKPNFFRKFTETETRPTENNPGNVPSAAPGRCETEESGNQIKRQVIIDGSNVAYSHGKSQFFSVDGIRIAIDYFEKIGHQVKAVVPSFRSNPNQSSNPELLRILYRSGKVLYAPCKNLPNLKSLSYDDRFILQIASELDAAVVSNDNYRDLINESPEFKTIIESRVVSYMWCDDMFMPAKDPYGRNGPLLHHILQREEKKD